MRNKQRVSQAIIMFITISTLISACEVSLSSPPASTPTLIPTGLFVSPFPSVENPMAMIEQFAKQTAAAQTAAAGGITITPGTAQVGVTGTMITPQSGASATPS